jgi:hypothetical protein
MDDLRVEARTPVRFPKRRPGKPIRITPPMLDRICAFVRAGEIIPRRAAVAAGCPADTFDQAIRRGRGPASAPHDGLVPGDRAAGR